MMVGGKESDGLTFKFETISPVLSLIGTIGPRGDLSLVLTELQLISTPVARKAYSLRVLIKMLLPTR